MTEIDWGTEGGEAPTSKRRVPVWLWACGSGCALALIVAAILAFVVARAAREMLDPERQWAELAEVLPYDERPPGVQMLGTGAIMSWAPGIVDAWQLQNQRELWQVQFLLLEGSEATQLRRQFAAGEVEGAGERFGPIGVFEPASGRMDVQGRELPWLRFQTFERSAQGEPEPAEPASDKPSLGQVWSMATKQRMMMLDLTREGASEALIVQYHKLGPGAPVSEDEVRSFLAPFHVGPER